MRQSTTTTAVHNIIAHHLFPERSYELGETESYEFRDVNVSLKRVGNGFGECHSASTYRYTFAGKGFRSSFIAVWDGGNLIVQPTALEPIEDAAIEEFDTFLNGRAEADAA